MSKTRRAYGDSYPVKDSVLSPENRSERRRQRHAAMVAARREILEAMVRPPSLPSVSILSSDIDVSVQDYRAGLLARREAGL